MPGHGSERCDGVRREGDGQGKIILSFGSCELDWGDTLCTMSLPKFRELSRIARCKLGRTINDF
jgi:hypothetical protein